MKFKLLFPVLLGTAAVAAPLHAQETPAVATVNLPLLYQAEIDRARAFVDPMIAEGVAMPVPRDSGGGYTHEQHKRNYRAIYLGGQLYRITGEQRYRDYVRDLLMGFAELYPTLGEHPARANQHSGRIFWQVLNDAVWQVYSIQGYEAIRHTLGKAERERIDTEVFRRASNFLSIESKETFNRIHNHATWATAAVGMTGYVLGDKDLVERALLGSDKTGTGGFLRQTELLFSPDGYYSEGAYYQRYAIMPFMVFADAIARNDPDRAIFAYRDGILLKALTTAVQQTYNGHFLPFNDALKEKSLRTDELYNAIAIAYGQTRDPGLLSIAQWQGHTVLSDNGLLLARDLAAGKAQPFGFRSQRLRDGPEGDQGAVAIFRRGGGLRGTLLLAKNSSQGMGHGHFDKLTWQFYDNGHEIVTDYGAARFLNIEAKQGGRYLPENTSWAKQTVAHNTLVVNGKSHFDGELRTAEEYAPRQIYYSDKPDLQVSTAAISTAYPKEQVAMLRTLALVDVEGLAAPVVVDIMRAEGKGRLTFDLPLHYSGQIMETGFVVERNLAERPVLGAANGYQHIWVDGTARPQTGQAYFTWLKDDRFYTYRFVPRDNELVILAESGANDPSFNLRREPMMIQRVEGTDRTAFVGVLETHGWYDAATELTAHSRSQIASLRHVNQSSYDLVVIETASGRKTAFAVSYVDDPAARHTATIDGREVVWTGFAARIPLDQGEK